MNDKNKCLNVWISLKKRINVWIKMEGYWRRRMIRINVWIKMEGNFYKIGQTDKIIVKFDEVLN